MLEDAVRISPLAMRRQMQLGKLALRNEDFQGASKAYRSAVEQGRNSRLKSPENYLGLSQALIAGDDSLDKRALAEINQTLAELDNQYGDDPALQVRARLMQASSLQKSGDPTRAAQLAAQAAAQLDSLGEFLSAAAALPVAGQLQQLGQAEAGAAL